jgi:23S rRNA G2445 N2-methylase RlmL
MTRDGQRLNVKEDAPVVCMYVTCRPAEWQALVRMSPSPLDDTRYVARAHLAGLERTDPGLYASTRGTNQGAWLHSAGRVD